MVGLFVLLSILLNIVVGILKSVPDNSYLDHLCVYFPLLFFPLVLFLPMSDNHLLDIGYCALNIVEVLNDASSLEKRDLSPGR